MLFRSRRTAYLIGYGISALGTGLVLPLAAIFISSELDLGASGIALYFAATAGAGMLFTPVGGWIGTRSSARTAVLVGASLQIVGFLVLSAATSLTVVVIAALIAGAGNGIFFANLTTFLLSVFGQDGLSSLFGWQYAVANIAVAVAAVIVVIAFLKPTEAGYRMAFVANGLSTAVYALVLMAIKAPSTSRTPPEEEKPKAWYAPFFDRSFAPIPLIQFGIVAFGIVQLDSVIPIVMNGTYSLGPSAVAAVLVVNGLSVVALQKFGNAFAAARGSAFCIIGALGAWIFGAGFLLVALPAGVEPLIAFLIYAVLFALGEVLVAPALQPWVVSAAPRSALPVYAAAVSLAFGIGQVVGPAVGAAVLSRFDTNTYLIASAACLAALIPAAVVQSKKPPVVAQDKEPMPTE